MNETETPLTIGATEDTGKRPVKTKKKAPAKKGVKKKAPAKKSAGKSSKAAPSTSQSKSKTKKPGKSSTSSSAAVKRAGTGGGKKPGKSKAGATARRVTASTSIPSVVDPSTAVPTKTYGIARIDQPEKKNHGYYVRLGRKKPDGTGLTLKFFSDKKLGSQKKALAAATAFRDEQFALLPDKLKLRAAKPRKPYTKKAA